MPLVKFHSSDHLQTAVLINHECHICSQWPHSIDAGKREGPEVNGGYARPPQLGVAHAWSTCIAISFFCSIIRILFYHCRVFISTDAATSKFQSSPFPSAGNHELLPWKLIHYAELLYVFLDNISCCNVILRRNCCLCMKFSVTLRSLALVSRVKSRARTHGFMHCPFSF